MEYGQFIKILEGEKLNQKETVNQLKDIIQLYPYFQTAHILLAKALQEQNNIDFDRVLKLAAVYAGDRSVLFDYINKKETRAAAEISELVSYSQIEEEVKETPEVKVAEPAIPTPSFIKKEEPYKEYFSEEEILGIEEEVEEKKEKIYDPHDLIRKRLSEILGASPSTTKEEPIIEQPGKIEHKEPTVPLSEIKVGDKREEVKAESDTGIPEEKSAFAEASADKEGIIAKEAEKANDPLARMEVEYAMEASILESLGKLPPLPQKPKEKPIQENEHPSRSEKEKVEPSIAKADITSHRTFNDWLRAISPKPFYNYMEVHSVSDSKNVKADESLLIPEEEPIENASTEDELIDRFIATEPKIVPSKTDFYSPINQAKKSLIEHDDVVSETLAKIYRDQGNTAKARWCYERLMLLHPEKSSFFAALLKEIDYLNKEDL
jgi:hypothetical protein